MKRFAYFVKKEYLHILRDWRTMLILLGMPIVEIILFGFAISTEIRGINLVVVSPMQSENIRQITNKIDANEYFHVIGSTPSVEKAQALIKKGDADIILRFPADFERSITQGNLASQIIVDASNPNIALSQQMYLQGIVSSYFSQKTNNLSAKPNIQVNSHMMYNPRMESSYNFVPGILGLIMIIICAMMTSISIVREKETGTMELLLTSPIRAWNIIAAKMIPYFTLSCINLIAILLLSRFVLDVPMAGSLFWILTISIIYILLSLALGLLISTLVKTQMVAMLCSAMLLMLPILLLSGMLFPIESAPKLFQWISCTVPARWYIDAMRKLMIEGVSIKYVLKEMTILICMTGGLITLSLYNFKNRL
jgi:ABC-type multidrug transport system, permease component